MKLKSLTITRQESWQSNAGQYVATIEYENAGSNTSLLLSPELSMQLLAFCGPAISAAARKTSLELEDNIKLSLEEAKKLPEIAIA